MTISILRTLLPELLTFAYIPANHLKCNGLTQQPEPRRDVYSEYVGATQSPQYDENEHVLILEMNDNMVRKKRPPVNSQVPLSTISIFRLTLLLS